MKLNVKFSTATQNDLAKIDILNGQIIALKDGSGFFYDFNDTRHKVSGTLKENLILDMNSAPIEVNDLTNFDITDNYQGNMFINKIYLSSAVSRVATGSFENCENLKDVYIDNLEKNIVIEEGAFPETTNIHYMGEFNASELITEAMKALAILNTNILHVADFGAKGDGKTDDTAAINTAIQYVLENGGTLNFKGDATYIISSPILILSPGRNRYETNPDLRCFKINFNNCLITIAYEGGEDISNIDITDMTPEEKHEIKKRSKRNRKPIFTPYKKGSTICDTMIYVSCNYAQDEKLGYISDVQLDPDYYIESLETPEIDADGFEVTEHGIPGVHTGIWTDSSTKICYENIVINNTQRGIYIGSGYEVFINNISIRKTTDGDLDLLPSELEEAIKNDYINNTCIGIDLNATDSHLSNIVISDHLVGIRALKGDNRIYGAHIWNLHNPRQLQKSVCFINGSVNFYTNCVADHFYVGWLDYYATPYYLTNCNFIHKGARDIHRIKDDSTMQQYIPMPKCYAFYFGDVNCATYDGNGIVSFGTRIQGQEDRRKNVNLYFCNRKNPQIEFSGISKYCFDIPEHNLKIIPGDRVTTCDYNNKIDQIGKVKSVEKTIENTEQNPFNIITYEPKDIIVTNTNGKTWIDNKANALGTTGTLYAGQNTKIEYSDEIFSILPTENIASIGLEQLVINTTRLANYKLNEAFMISFDYYSEPEGEINQYITNASGEYIDKNGNVVSEADAELCINYQTKEVRIDSGNNLKDYFTNDAVWSIPLENTENNVWKSFSKIFKVNDVVEDKNMIRIGHGVRYSSNSKIFDLAYNKNPVQIKNLKFINLSSIINILPKYYFETIKNYRDRINYAINNNFMFENNEPKILLQAYVEPNIVFKSEPFKYVWSDNNKKYQLSYSDYDELVFWGNTTEVSGNPVIYCDYDPAPYKRIKLNTKCVYPSYSSGVENEKPILEVYDKASNKALVTCRNYFYTDKTIRWEEGMSTLQNKIHLPSYPIGGNNNRTEDTIEEPYLINYLSINPYNNNSNYGITPEYKESIDENGKSIYIPQYTEIPCYSNGEVYLIARGQDYSIDLPTFALQYEYTTYNNLQNTNNYPILTWGIL